MKVICVRCGKVTKSHKIYGYHSLGRYVKDDLHVCKDCLKTLVEYYGTKNEDKIIRYLRELSYEKTNRFDTEIDKRCKK